MTGDLVAIDVGTGVATPVPKVGQVIGWFHDSGRFWTNDGPTTHIYEPDGAEIGVVVGGVMMGAYDHFLTAQSVRHVDMPGKDVKTVDVEFHARNGIKTKDGLLVTLEPDGVHESAMDLPDPQQYAVSRFGYDDGHWGIIASEGAHFDDLGRAYTPGRFEHVAATTSGRIAANTRFNRALVYDVTADCTGGKVGEFSQRFAIPLTLADDGGVALTQDNMNMFGTTFLTLPDGGFVEFVAGGDWESVV